MSAVMREIEPEALLTDDELAERCHVLWERYVNQEFETRLDIDYWNWKAAADAWNARKAH